MENIESTPEKGNKISRQNFLYAAGLSAIGAVLFSKLPFFNKKEVAQAGTIKIVENPEAVKRTKKA